MFWIILLGVILLSYLYLKHKHFENFWKIRGVPYIKPFPLLGNYYKTLFGTPMPDVLFQLYQAKPQAKVLGLYFFGKTPLMIRDPGLLRQICIKDFDHFVDHFSPSEGDNANESDPFLKRNLSVLKGEHWRMMRSILTPAFTGNKMHSMFLLMQEIVETFIKHFQKRCLGQKASLPLDVELKSIYVKLTNDIIATTAFGIKCNSFDEPENIFYQMAQLTQQFQMWKMFLMILSPKLWKILGLSIFPAKVYKYFSRVVKDTIEMRHKYGIVRPDMIHLLMEAQKETLHKDKVQSKQGKNVNGITNEDITMQAFTFFTAGFETVSTTLSFASYELAVNSELQMRLQKEIDDTFTKCDGNLTYDILNKMVYLDMIVSETLRKWPVPVTDRVCTKAYDFEVDKVKIHLQPGDLVHLPFYAIQHDPKYYPEPDKFDPERFSEENKKNIVPFTYMPFGVGPRACIGSRFALIETKLALFYMFRNFELVVTKHSDIPLKLKSSTALSAKRYCVGLKPRQLD